MSKKGVLRTYHVHHVHLAVAGACLPIFITTAWQLVHHCGQHLPQSIPQAPLLLLNNVAAANQHRWHQTSTYTGGFSVHTVSVKRGEGSAGHLICEGAQAQRPDTINSLTASTCLAEAAKAGQNHPGLPES